MTRVLRIATRASRLAQAQAGLVADAITRGAGIPTELVTVTTHGDVSDRPLAQIGGTGVFATRMREALLAGDCDLVVHSMKDLPTAPFPGLAVAAVPRRADARDALCARDGLTLAGLPVGAVIGTGSPRRMAQLKWARPDAEVRDLRGNIDSRLGHVGVDLDAVLLATAGLERIGALASVTERFPLSQWPTAPAQGALAVEVRDGDQRAGGAIAQALHAVDDAESYATATAERAVLAGLEAGCAAPIGATAQVDDGLLFLTATVYRPDGGDHRTSSHATSLEGPGRAALLDAALDAASRVVDELLASGAADLAPIGGAVA